MTETAYDRVTRALEAAGSPRPANESLNWRCPAHDDGQASLNVTAVDGKVLIRCHANCPTSEVLDAIGLRMSDLFDAPPERSGNGSEKPEIEATYDYTDEAGRQLFQVVRMRPKGFRQRRSDGRGGWVWNLQDTRREIYHLPAVLAAVQRGEIVYIVEGEKDVHALEAAGLTATCNPGGAGKWREEYNRHFAGAVVSIVADRDETGRKHAQLVAEALTEIAADLDLLEPAHGKDVADHLGAGLGVADLVPLVDPDAPKPDLDIGAFLNQEEPDYEWLVEGLLERGDRLILTGPEGGGKSTLLRQIAVQMGAGIHPFTLDEIPPVKVMLLDLENSRRQVKRKLRPVWLAAQQHRPELDPGSIRVRVVTEGIDLLSEVYQEFLERRLEANRPDVLICGPLYKLSGGDPTEERVAKTVAMFLDRMRTKFGIAVVMEAHSPHPVGNAKRTERPYGASLWLRWPEFGLYLDKSGAVRHWRGPRDEREWPTLFKRGGEWQWEAVTDARTITFAQVLDACQSAGRKLSLRELEERLEGSSKNTIDRAIKANQKQFDEVTGWIERGVDEDAM